MELTDSIIKRTYYSLGLAVLAWAFFRGKSSQNPAFRKVQIAYYFAYFAILIPDQAIITYTNKFFVFKDYPKHLIHTLSIVQQAATLFGSMTCGPILDKVGNRFVIMLSCFTKIVSLIILSYTEQTQLAVVSKLLWGFSYILAKIGFDHWLVEVTTVYELSSYDRSILLEQRSLFSLIIDVVFTNVIDKIVKNFDVVSLFKSVLLIDIIISLPIYFSISSGTKRKLNKEKSEKKAETDRPIDLETIKVGMIDTIYCLSTGLFKSQLSTNFLNQNLPFSMIMATYTVSLSLGTSAYTVVEQYKIDSKFLKFVLIGFMVGNVCGYLSADNDILAYMVTIILGFMDGITTSHMVSARKEFYPANHRGTILSIVRTGGSLIHMLINFMMSYLPEEIYFVVCASAYLIVLFIYIFVQPSSKPKISNSAK